MTKLLQQQELAAAAEPLKWLPVYRQQEDPASDQLSQGRETQNMQHGQQQSNRTWIYVSTQLWIVQLTDFQWIIMHNLLKVLFIAIRKKGEYKIIFYSLITITYLNQIIFSNIHLVFWNWIDSG